jgi:hypothetical protein
MTTPGGNLTEPASIRYFRGHTPMPLHIGARANGFLRSHAIGHLSIISVTPILSLAFKRRRLFQLKWTNDFLAPVEGLPHYPMRPPFEQVTC